MASELPVGLTPTLSFLSNPSEDESAAEGAPLIHDTSPSHGHGASCSCERAWGRRSQFTTAIPLAVFGVVLMAAFAVLALRADAAASMAVPAAVPLTKMKLTPRQLFESPRFTDVATDNVLAVARGSIPASERAQVRAEVARQLREISADLWQRYPSAGWSMDQVSLEPEEQDGFITMMSSVSNPRVHELGRDIGLYLHKSLTSATDSVDAKLQVVDSLEPRLAMIRRLRDEVIPEVVRGPAGSAEDSHLIIDAEGVSFMKQFDRWNVQVAVSMPHVGESEPALGLQGRRLSADSEDPSAGKVAMKGLVKYAKLNAQAEKFFKQVQEFAAANYNVHVPDMDEAFRGVDTSKAVKCAMEAAVAMNPAAAMQCIMEFWSIAMDVMQNIANGIGVVTTSTERTVFKSKDDMFD